MDKKILIIIGIVFFVFIYALAFVSVKKTTSVSTGGGVGILEITDVLTDSKPYRKILEKLSKRRDVKALLVYINSPGGGVVASQEIYYAIRKFKEEKKVPVVAYISSVGASGGYYVAVAADKIMAAPGAITGSIGVIAEFPAFHELLSKIGIKFRVFKKGKFKDVGSPFRDMTEEEKEYLDELLEDVYKQFVQTVAERRNLDTLNLKEWAEGRIFTGRQAKKIGLIDSLGTYEDALSLAGELAGIKGKPKEIRIPKRKKGLLYRLLEGITDVPLFKIEYKMVF